MSEHGRRCARCKRDAPPLDVGPEGRARQGWVTFESDSTLIVDVPYPEASILPREIA